MAELRPLTEYERKKKVREQFAKREQWRLIVKPIVYIIKTAMENSAEFAVHCLTGLHHNDNECSLGDTVSFRPQKKSIIGKIVLMSYLCDFDNEKAVYSAL